MASFAPDVPESPEPNYLRYSRPSNFAPINKGPGEAIKAVAEVGTMGLKTVDSVVKAGLTSYVQTEAGKEQQAQIGLLENQYQSVTGINPQTGERQSLVNQQAENVPTDVKTAQSKMEAMQMWKARGGAVTAAYDAQKNSFLKDLRSKYPAFTATIDQASSRTFGDRNANEYISNLRAGIQAAESKIDNEQKRKENIVDTFTKEGNISPVMRTMYDQGKLNADYLIHQGTVTAYQKKQGELHIQNNAIQESDYKLSAAKAERNANDMGDIFLAQTMKDRAVVQGSETTPKFLQLKADIDSGKIPALSPEQQLQFNQSYDVEKDRHMAQWDGYARTSGLVTAMGPEAYGRLRKDREEAFNLYQGMSNPKDWAMQHSYQKWMEAKTEGEHIARELSDTGQFVKGLSDWNKISGNNPAMERHTAEILNSKLGKDGQAFLSDNLIRGITGTPGKEGGNKPSVHTTLNDLNRLGFKGTEASMVVNWADMIKDSSVPDKAKEGLVDYFLAGDGTKIFSQLAKESPTPVLGKDYTVSAEGRPITKGKFYLSDKLFSPETVDAVHKLGGQAWLTYKDGVTSATRTMLGSEIPDLNKYAEQGFKFSWDNKNHSLSIAQGEPQLDPQYPAELGRTIPAERVTSGIQREVDNVNRILKGISNVAAKEPNIDVNAYLLKALQEGGLGDNEASKAIMRSIISSHKSSALASPQGEVMSDAGDQMGMGATAMNVPKPPGQFGPQGGESLPAIRPGAGGGVPGNFNLAPKGGVPSKISTDQAKFDKLMEGVQAGKGQRTMAKELGIGRSSVQRYLQDQLQVKESPGVVESFWKSDKVNTLKKLYSQGYSQAEIARKLGTSPANIPFQLNKLQEAGELPDLSKRTPSLPKLKFLETPMEPE